jgi:tRNA U34 5-methylaminomethyl-2-thiouridine-forming methyltransferase MnmC
MKQQSPGVFEKLETLDGCTLRDPVTGQPMHSTIGPMPEARQIYLRPALLDQRLTQGSHPLVLWDVGMGIAANSLAAFSLALSLKSSRPLQIHSFESAPDGIRQALQEIESFAYLKPYTSQLTELLSHGSTRLGPHEWKLYEGDFRSLTHVAPPAEVIFFDLYSPRVASYLWSVPVMERLRQSSPEATLVTYSAATPVRLALLLAGWWVGRPGASGPVTALKNESTVAIASEAQAPWLENPLPIEWIDKFRHSSQAKPCAAEASGPAHTDPWSELSFEQLEALLTEHPQFKPGNSLFERRMR